MAKKKNEDGELAAEVSFLQSELSIARKDLEDLDRENRLLVAENQRLTTLLKRREDDFDKLRNSML